MGSTAKIIFSSILALSIAVMFLVFSMQKSAQLTLDLQDVENTIQKKDVIISDIEQKLRTAEESVVLVTTQNDQISQQNNQISTIESEKHTYLQQVEELKEQLQQELENSTNHLAKLEQLQKNHTQQQALLEEKEKNQLSSELLTSQAQDELQATNTLLAQKEEEMKQFLLNLEQKDQTIIFYREKIETATKEIASLKTSRSSDQLNRSVLLNELAAKTEAVAHLTDQVEQLTGSAPVGTNAENGAITAVLKNTAPETEAGSVAASEMKQLESTNTMLRTSINEQIAFIEGLQNALLEKENALSAAIQEGQEALIPLNERITVLENKLTTAKQENIATTNDLKTAQATNSELLKLTESLNADLAFTKSNLENALQQAVLLNDSLTNSAEALKNEESSRLSLTQEIESSALALAASKDQSTSLRNEYEQLANELANKNQEDKQQEERVARLIEEVAAAKAFASEQAETIQAADVQLTALTEKKRAQDTTLNEKQEAIVTLETQLTSLTEERDQLLAKTPEPSDTSEALEAPENSDNDAAPAE